MKIKDSGRRGECFRYRTYRRKKNLDILLDKMKLYFLHHYTKSTRRISVMFPYLLHNVYSCQICYAMFTRARTAHPDGRFFMQAIRIIPSILFQPFLFQNSG